MGNANAVPLQSKDNLPDDKKSKHSKDDKESCEGGACPDQDATPRHGQSLGSGVTFAMTLGVAADVVQNPKAFGSILGVATIAVVASLFTKHPARNSAISLGVSILLGAIVILIVSAVWVSNND